MLAPGRLVLAIENSNPSAATPAHGPGVVLARAGSILASRPIAPTEPDPADPQIRDDGIMPAIDAAVRDAGLTPADLRGSLILFSAGPGGFTALRIACACARMIAEALACETLSLPSAFVAAQGAGRPRAVALASKHDSAWITVFSDEGPAPEARLMTAADVPAIAQARTLAADPFLPEPIRAAAMAQGMTIEPLELSAEKLLQAGLAALASGRARLAGAEGLRPVYAREPEAITKWRALGRAL
jgi:tRNA A37 threonylcarbamoyladenosine modification protein TsaB